MRTVLSLSFVLLLAGCHTSSPIQPTPVSTAQTAPAVMPSVTQFVASPTQVERGQAVSLTIVTMHASRCQVDGIGEVPCGGHVLATPPDGQRTVTWTLHATNDAGDVTATTQASVRLVDVMYRVYGPGYVHVGWQNEQGWHDAPIFSQPFAVDWERVAPGTPLRLSASADRLARDACVCLEIWTNYVKRASQYVCGDDHAIHVEVAATY